MRQAVALCGAILLGGCADQLQTGESAPAASAPEALSPERLRSGTVIKKLEPGVRMIQPSLTVVLPAANWPRQTPLDVTVKVENLTGVDMDLTLLSGMTADLLLAKSGQPVWRFSQERMFTQALRPWPLASGEARTLTFTIGTEVLTSLAPGGYSLQAQLNTFDRPSSAPVALTLE